jgi:hypothetical protein
MALQTVRTKASVSAFLAAAAGDRLADCRTINAMMKEVTGAPAEMWGPAIIGFGSCQYRYPDGRTMDWMLVAYSPRKTGLVLYLESEFPGKAAMLKRLGKHKQTKACLHVKRLADVDVDVLREMIAVSVAASKAKHA